MNSNREEWSHSSKLEALINSVPGGVCGYKMDDYFTVTSISANITELTGYTPEEIESLFQNRFIEVIHPDDRERILAEARLKNDPGKVIEFEYRICCKGGQIKWVLDRGKTARTEKDEDVIYCMLLDITRRKKLEEELRLSVERHQLIMNHATDVIFEWNMEKDTLEYSKNWASRLGFNPIYDHVSTKILFSSHINKEDRGIVEKLIRNIKDGAESFETEVRVIDSAGAEIWCRVRVASQCDANQRPIKAIGIITDIDREKRRNERLRELAERDALTGLYNKAAIQSVVQRQMDLNRDKDGYHMLMIIDLDNFKPVNDTYGHLCGDALLKDVGDAMRRMFRSTDLLGRIGGDEFLVYLPDIRDQQSAVRQAEKILDELCKIRPDRDLEKLSCSIGIVLKPHQEVDYLGMYKNADIALYHVKADGKGSFLFYDQAALGDKIPLNIKNTDIYASVGAVKASDTDKELVQYTFQMLYGSTNVNRSVNRLLEIIGKSYDVSRVYIFENSRDNTCCSNTFEWCNDAITPEIDNLQNISYDEDLENYHDYFDENGIFYCSDVKVLDPSVRAILEPQGVYALLQCAIIADGKFKGYVGFVECHENRKWTKAQIDSLTLVANILSIFLANERLKEELEEIKTVK